MVVSGWGGPRWLEDGAMGRCWSSESVELENGERPASTTEKEAGQAATFLNRKAVVCVDLARATAGVGLLAQVARPFEAEGAGAGLVHSALLAGEPGGTIFFTLHHWRRSRNLVQKAEPPLLQELREWRLPTPFPLWRLVWRRGGRGHCQTG